MYCHHGEGHWRYVLFRHFDAQLRQETNGATWILGIVGQLHLAELLLEIDMGKDRGLVRAQLFEDITGGIMELIPKLYICDDGESAIYLASDLTPRLMSLDLKLEVDGIDGIWGIRQRLHCVLKGVFRRVLEGTH